MPAAARQGDMHTCPAVAPGPTPHVGGPIQKGSGDVKIEHMAAARATDAAVCAAGGPDKIAQGCGTVKINFLPAARVTDKTVHGGVIVKGAGTVIIGVKGDAVTVLPIGGGGGAAAKSKGPGDGKEGRDGKGQGDGPESEGSEGGGEGQTGGAQKLTDLIIRCSHEGGSDGGNRNDNGHILAVISPDTLTFTPVPAMDGVTVRIGGQAQPASASYSVKDLAPVFDWVADAQPQRYTVAASTADGSSISKELMVYPGQSDSITLTTDRMKHFLARTFWRWFYWIDRISGKKFDIEKDGLSLSVGGVKISVPNPSADLKYAGSWKEKSFKEHASDWWQCYYESEWSAGLGLSITLSCPFGGAAAGVIGGPGAKIAYDAFAPYLNAGEDPFFIELGFSLSGRAAYPTGGSLGGTVSLSLNMNVTANILSVEISGRASIAASAGITGQISPSAVLSGSWNFGRVAGTVSFKVVTGWIWVSETSYERELVICEGWGDSFGELDLVDTVRKVLGSGSGGGQGS